jgi:hypothetical protein
VIGIRFWSLDMELVLWRNCIIVAYQDKSPIENIVSYSVLSMVDITATA